MCIRFLDLEFNHVYFPAPVGSIAQPKVSEEELRKIEASYAVKDRSWVTVLKNRRVCAMGKYYMKDDISRLKELACKRKEKAAEKEKEKVVVSNLKRKESYSTQARKPSSNKRVKIPTEGDEIKSKDGQSNLHVVVAGPLKDKGNETAQGARKGGKTSFESTKLKLFIDDVVQAFAFLSS